MKEKEKIAAKRLTEWDPEASRRVQLASSHYGECYQNNCYIQIFKESLSKMYLFKLFNYGMHPKKNGSLQNGLSCY